MDDHIAWPALSGAAVIAIVAACGHSTGSKLLSADALMLSIDQIRAIAHFNLEADPKFVGP